eukprot:gb/GECG01007058.1/.p1 GENE.gb/GECG01007058.1/~~gb/GECG01007058.1/.p1  ORF type:complete len:159 (+),score=34.19 gb/GECG01007058.1/:1-477(+)
MRAAERRRATPHPRRLPVPLKALRSKLTQRRDFSTFSVSCESFDFRLYMSRLFCSYRRFLHNKRVSNYSKRDLSAILGIVHHDNAQPDGTSLENGFAVSAEGEFLGNQEDERDDKPDASASEATAKGKKKEKKKKRVAEEESSDASVKKSKKRRKEKK